MTLFLELMGHLLILGLSLLLILLYANYGAGVFHSLLPRSVMKKRLEKPYDNEALKQVDVIYNNARACQIVAVMKTERTLETLTINVRRNRAMAAPVSEETHFVRVGNRYEDRPLSEAFFGYKLRLFSSVYDTVSYKLLKKDDREPFDIEVPQGYQIARIKGHTGYRTRTVQITLKSVWHQPHINYSVGIDEDENM